MCWEKKGPLGAQLPISASVVGRYDVVVGGDVGIDRLVTDLDRGNIVWYSGRERGNHHDEPLVCGNTAVFLTGLST
jgi:hypothetical protein